MNSHDESAIKCLLAVFFMKNHFHILTVFLPEYFKWTLILTNFNSTTTCNCITLNLIKEFLNNKI